MKNDIKIKIFAFSAICLAISLILGYIEVILPIPINIGDIGIKIGLPNVISIIGIKKIGIKRTFLINILRLLILGVLFGNLVRFILSVSGFLLSFLIMCILFKFFDTSIIFTSIFGGVSHNIGQLVAIIFIIKNINILYVLPLLLILGIISGTIVGVISSISYNKINMLNFDIS